MINDPLVKAQSSLRKKIEKNRGQILGLSPYIL